MLVAGLDPPSRQARADLVLLDAALRSDRV